MKVASFRGRLLNALIVFGTIIAVGYILEGRIDQPYVLPILAAVAGLSAIVVTKILNRVTKKPES